MDTLSIAYLPYKSVQVRFLLDLFTNAALVVLVVAFGTVNDREVESIPEVFENTWKSQSLWETRSI